MMRHTGFAGSFLAATILAVLPFGAARAEIAPADPLEPAVAAAAAGDGADLPARLVGAGLPADGARALVARLGPDERAFVAERADGAQAGGYFFIWPVAMIAVGIAFGIMAIVKAMSSPDADAEGEAEAEKAPAVDHEIANP